ncbi:MAG: DUF58 domain-containing protein [Phycisphaerae bacterium]
MVRATQDYRRYLDPAVLAKISGLDLRARRLVQGFISGMHRSPHRGFSVEFAEHRKYSQGDDVRFIDWKVFGRTDKHYVKQYVQETNLQLLLLVDCSESMRYRSPASALSKREYAVTAAAALAYLALQQSDAVGAATFDTELHPATRTSNNPGQWKAVVRTLEQAEGTGGTAFRTVMDMLAESLAHRHMIVILSDLFGEPHDIVSGLKHLRHRGHEPIVLQILDDAELNFPFSKPLRFRGLEGTGEVLTEPRVIRERYLRVIRAFIDEMRRGCHDQRIDFEFFNTRASMSTVLSAFLATRAARLSRGR